MAIFMLKTIRFLVPAILLYGHRDSHHFVAA
jgi:hypothetical protein